MQIIELESIDSTNDYAIKLIEKKNICEDTCVFTNYQKSGKGDGQSTWESEQDQNLTFSIILKLHKFKAEQQFYISKFASLLVIYFLKNIANYDFKIKWPNDIFINKKKIAGILIENTIKYSEIEHTIIGIGININQTNFASLPNATSLKKLTNTDFDTKFLLNNFINIFNKNKYLLEDKYTLDKHYLENLYLLNEYSYYKDKTDTFKAKISGVQELGYLILEKENGELKTFAKKEIELVLF